MNADQYVCIYLFSIFISKICVVRYDQTCSFYQKDKTPMFTLDR